MGRKIPRKWARASIVLSVVWLLFWAAALLTGHPVLMIPGIVFLIPAFVIKYALLRCPGCGRGGAMPQWSRSGNYHCPICGAKLEYDM